MKTDFRRLLAFTFKLFLFILFVCLSLDKSLIASDKMSEKFLEDILNDTEIPMDRTSPTSRVEDPFLEGIQFAQGLFGTIRSVPSMGSQPKQKRNGLHFGFMPEEIFTSSYMEGLEVVQETNRRIQNIFDNNVRENPSLIRPDDTFTKGYIEGLEFVEQLTKQHAEFFDRRQNEFEQDQDCASEAQADSDLEKSSQEAIDALTIDGEEFSSGALTPRTYSRREAELKAEQNNRLIDELYSSNSWLSPSDESTYKSAYEDVNEAGQKAYLKTQSEIASKANEKIKQGEPLTEYERLVRRDDRVEHQRYWKQMGGYAVGASLGVTAALTAPVSAPLAVGLAITGGAIDGVASLDYAVNTRKDAVIVVGSALVGGATLFLPGTGIEVSASMKSILGATRSTLGHGSVKIPGQVTSNAAHEMAALDLAHSKSVIIDRKLFQNHHIISDKHHLTFEHPLWDAAGITPNDPRNMIKLPTVKGSELGANSRSVHQGRHLDEVNAHLAERMDFVLKQGQTLNWTQSQYAEALTKIMNAERTILKAGDRALNKNARSNAKRMTEMKS